MDNVVIRHTAELDDASLAAARSLCNATFGDDFADANWEHALGGVHALRFEGERLIAHGALVARRFLHRGQSLRTGYVEAVVVWSLWRPIASAEVTGPPSWQCCTVTSSGPTPWGALASSNVGAALYLTMGWTRWTGPMAVLACECREPCHWL